MLDVENGIYKLENGIRSPIDLNKIDVMQVKIDANGNKVPGNKVTMTVWLDDEGKVYQTKHIVGSGGERGSGYGSTVLPQPPSGIEYERGHIKFCQEGAFDNCVEDSPINIVAQTADVNDPFMKAFEKFRVLNCQGMEVTTNILENGYVKVREFLMPVLMLLIILYLQLLKQIGLVIGFHLQTLEEFIIKVE